MRFSYIITRDLSMKNSCMNPVSKNKNLKSDIRFMLAEQQLSGLVFADTPQNCSEDGIPHKNVNGQKKNQFFSVRPFVRPSGTGVSEQARFCPKKFPDNRMRHIFVRRCDQKNFVRPFIRNWTFGRTDGHIVR